VNIAYNFVSVVVLGRFNPGILTPDFLTKVCSMPLSKPQYLIPPEMPFPREIRFSENISFLIDLERLQIAEHEVKNIQDVSVAKYAKLYLEKLPYTPISTAGVNFNFSLRFDEQNEKEQLCGLIQNESNLFSKFDIREYNLKVEKVCSQSRPNIYNYWIMTFQTDEGFYSSLRINFNKRNVIELNHNAEVKNLNEKPEQINLLLGNYNNVVKYHESIKNVILGIKK
jgi:hypothetical protein